jgi:ligand-binding sensor domain-containing protein
VPFRVRVESVVGRESVRSHVLEDSRRLYQRPDHLDCSDAGRLPLDGVRNVSFQPPPGQQLPSTQIFSLLAARDGTLWIGTSKGLASWKDGKLTQFAELDDHYIFKLLEDHEGSVWASGMKIPTGKLCAIRDGGTRCYGEDGALGRGVFNLYEDSKGNLWAGVKEGLWRWKPGPPTFYPLGGEPNGIRGLGEDDDGTLLVGWRGGVHRFVDGRTEAYPLQAIVGQFQAKRLLRDHDGGLWIGTQERGLVHVHHGRIDVFTPSDGLSGDDILNLFEDREGNIWVATIHGLDRFREFAVATLTVNQGLSNDLVGAVLADRDGSVWLATRGGLNRWKDGQMTVYRERAARSMTGVREIVGSGLPDKGLVSLFQDDRGRIWVSTLRGAGYLENDRFISLSGLSGGIINLIAQDGAGTLWFASERVGLYQLPRGSEVRHIPWAALGGS